MRDWLECELSELVEIDPEMLNATSRGYQNFFYIDISSVVTGRISIPMFPIQLTEAPSRARKILKNNDVILSNVRPGLKAIAIFNSHFNSAKYVASTGFSVLRDKGIANTSFIYYSLLSSNVQRQMNCLAVGSNYPALNTNDVCKLKIFLPKDLDEQTRIAEILSKADKAIAQTEALIAKYQRIKTGLMHDLLTKGIDEHGNIRSKATHRFVVKNGIEVPEDWEVVELNEVLAKPLTYGIVQPGNHEPEGVVMIRSQDYSNGWNSVETMMKVASEIDRPYERSRVFESDLLITVVGANVGRMEVVPIELSGANISRSVARLAIDKDENDSKFFLYYLKSSIAKILFENTVGGAQPVLNLKELNEILVVKPLKLEQSNIAKRINKIESFIEKLILNHHKLQSLKVGLMQDLLSGKVSVKMNN